MKRLGQFTEADLDAIQEAVASAERRSAGEIVVYIVGESDPYPEATWKALAAGTLIGLAGATAWQMSRDWGGDPLRVALAAALGGLACAVLARFSLLRRLLLRNEVVTRRVALRAEAAFLEEEVFATRERTGILLFLSLLEHRALLLADVGIHEKVGEDKWVGIVDELVAKLRGGDRAPAVLAAVEQCGQLLDRHGVERADDDTDELGNRPRLRRR